MKILALDLGKYKTVGCEYESESGTYRFQRSVTTPAALQKLVEEVKPDRVVIEVCSIAGWVCDLMRAMGIDIQVANTSDDAWRWRKVKQKDDRRDALKAARLSAVASPTMPNTTSSGPSRTKIASSRCAPISPAPISCAPARSKPRVTATLRSRI